MDAWKVGLLGSAALLALACKTQTPEQPVPDAGPPATVTAPTPVPTVVQPTATVTTPTEPQMVFGPCSPEVSNAMSTDIKRRAATEAGDTKNEAGFVCMVVHEGETASVPIFLDAGGCYTFLGHAYPQVTEVDLTLKPDFGANPPPILALGANVTIATDGDSGPQAAIGRKTCFKNPFPIGAGAKIEVKARTGAGPIAVKVYKR